MAAWQVRAVLAHMDARLAEPLTLDALARVAGVSRFHFSRCFRNAVGEPPLRHLARMRIAAACRLLRDSPAPVAEVAQAVGYRSPQAFARAFERNCGCTPSAYRTGDRAAGAARDAQNDPLASRSI